MGGSGGSGGGGGGGAVSATGSGGAPTRGALAFRAGALACAVASGAGPVAAACAPASGGGSAKGVAGRTAAIAMVYGTTVAEQDQLRAGPVRRFRERYPNVAVEEITAPNSEVKQKIL